MIGFSHLLDISSDDDEDVNGFEKSRVFLDHLRKCFIAIDENNFCEQGILTDLKISSDIKKSEKNLEQNVFLLGKRIEENAYDFNQITRNEETRNSMATRGSKPLLRFNSFGFETNESTKPIKEEPIDLHQNTLNLYELEVENSKTKPIISPLTQLLQKPVESPFLSYSRFESMLQDPYETKSFVIFIPTNEARSPIQINIFNTALVSDLIGLICYKYSIENRQPILKYDSVENYELKIADESGLFDDELMIESNQKLSKYGFKFLALVEKNKNESGINRQYSNTEKVVVKVNYTDDSPSEFFEFDSDNIQMKEVYKKIYQAKTEKIDLFCPRIDYKMEYVNKTGKEIDLENSFLSDFKKKYEFVFYRINSTRRESLTRNSICSLSFEMTQRPDVTRTVNENNKYELKYIGQWKRDKFKIGNLT
ncbi:unnamed protein product [Brachionus calyciflorus]|uniref:CRIM domain-containing protein n=1 Tax=Brachionus calyciflorus TaxID=104777 RepID=A0A813TWW5_9BILA|nr:unnamed protein product [Brachionus calyciflorus]